MVNDRPAEKVWDYPRPPRVERITERLRVIFENTTIADTLHGLRVLETSHPPVYYFPEGDVLTSALRPLRKLTYCEFKGLARYWSLELGDSLSAQAAWSYPSPLPDFLAIANHFAFYASRVDACFVEDEKVRPQAGDF